MTKRLSIKTTYTENSSSNNSSTQLFQSQNCSFNAVQQEQLIQIFANHCAIVIQSHFRSYLQRKRYKQFLPLYRRFKELALACFKGWKLRRVFRLNQVRSKINEIKKLQNQERFSHARIAKRSFLDDIVRLQKNGEWMDLLNKERRAKYGNGNIDERNRSKNKQAMYKTVKHSSVSLKEAFSSVTKNDKKNTKVSVKPVQKKCDKNNFRFYKEEQSHLNNNDGDSLEQETQNLSNNHMSEVKEETHKNIKSKSTYKAPPINSKQATTCKDIDDQSIQTSKQAKPNKKATSQPPPWKRKKSTEIILQPQLIQVVEKPLLSSTDNTPLSRNFNRIKLKSLSKQKSLINSNNNSQERMNSCDKVLPKRIEDLFAMKGCQNSSQSQNQPNLLNCKQPNQQKDEVQRRLYEQPSTSAFLQKRKHSSKKGGIKMTINKKDSFSSKQLSQIEEPFLHIYPSSSTQNNIEQQQQDFIQSEKKTQLEKQIQKKIIKYQSSNEKSTNLLNSSQSSQKVNNMMMMNSQQHQKAYRQRKTNEMSFNQTKENLQRKKQQFEKRKQNHILKLSNFENNQQQHQYLKK